MVQYLIAKPQSGRQAFTSHAIQEWGDGGGPVGDEGDARSILTRERRIDPSLRLRRVTIGAGSITDETLAG